MKVDSQAKEGCSTIVVRVVVQGPDDLIILGAFSSDMSPFDQGACAPRIS